MNGTEPNRFRLRDDRARMVTGWSSINAGAMFEPIVPAMYRSSPATSTRRRTGRPRALDRRGCRTHLPIVPAGTAGLGPGPKGGSP